MKKLNNKKGDIEITHTMLILLLILFLIVALVLVKYHGNSLSSIGNNMGNIFRRSG